MSVYGISLVVSLAFSAQAVSPAPALEPGLDSGGWPELEAPPAVEPGDAPPVGAQGAAELRLTPHELRSILRARGYVERRSWPIEEGVFTTHRLDAINGGPTVLTRTEHLRRRALSFRIDREGRVEPAALERTWSILQSPEAGAVIERDVRSVQVAATLKEELEFWRQTLEGRGPKVALTDSELRRFRELADDAWRHKYRRMCKGEVLGAKECFQVISPGRGKPKVFRLSLFQDLKACDSNEVEASRFDIAADGTIDPVVHGIYDRPGFCSPIKRFYASLEDPWSQALVTKKIRFWLFF